MHYLSVDLVGWKMVDYHATDFRSIKSIISKLRSYCVSWYCTAHQIRNIVTSIVAFTFPPVS